ncbi:uncharacterized protein [Littorina saxatilis]|uniref:uncharacterized protein n=1 Tax=Littorina saxatilis TaxID=31220 RepID=UPI0038B43767
MHHAGKLTSAASAPKPPLDTTTTSAITGSPPHRRTQTGTPSGIPSYDSHSKGNTALSIHAPPLFPHPALSLDPPQLPPPPPLHSSRQPSMAGVGVAGSGVTGDGGHVMVHWTQSGPSVHQRADRVGQQSGEEDDDMEDDDDELLTPPPPRERLSYTRYQLELLNGIYLAVRYPNSVQKQLIAKRVGISREQVKIWFQNRRRKDVVGGGKASSADKSPTSPSTSTQDPTSPSDSSCSSPAPSKNSNGDPQDGSKKSPDAMEGGEGQGEGQKSRMVPDAVVNGCISELKRFSDEKLKERKEKRKAKGKRRAHAPAVTGSANQPISRLFQAYDMVAPPNKVTPTAAAYINTSANRFNHSQNTSAFSNPRDYLVNASTMPRLAWDTGLDSLMSQSLSASATDQLAHSRAFGGLGMAGLGMGLLPLSQAQSAGGTLAGMVGPHDSLPVLSDLLSYRQHMEAADSSSRASRDSSLSQSSLLSSNSAASRDSTKLPNLRPAHHNGMAPPHPPSPFGLPRVYPFPFIADPPIMLSSLHQQDPLRHPPHWPHPHATPPSAPAAHFGPMVTMNGMDAYKPVMISSLSNPFFSPSANPAHWPPHPSADPATGTGFSQL